MFASVFIDNFGRFSGDRLLYKLLQQGCFCKSQYNRELHSLRFCPFISLTLSMKYQQILWIFLTSKSVETYWRRDTYTAWKLSKYGVISGPYFPVFGLTTETFFVNLRVQSEYRKVRARNNSVFGHFSRSVRISLRGEKTSYVILRLKLRTINHSIWNATLGWNGLMSISIQLLSICLLVLTVLQIKLFQPKCGKCSLINTVTFHLSPRQFNLILRNQMLCVKLDFL